MSATNILAWLMLMPLCAGLVLCIVGWLVCEHPKLAAWIALRKLPGRKRWIALAIVAVSVLIGADKAPPFSPLAWMITVLRDGKVLDPSGAIGKQATLAATQYVVERSGEITEAAYATVTNSLIALDAATNSLAHRTYKTAYLAQDLPRAIPNVHTNSNIAATIQKTEMTAESNLVAWVWFSEEPSMTPVVKMAVSIEPDEWRDLIAITNSFPVTTDIAGIPCVKYVYALPVEFRGIPLRPRYELDFGGLGKNDYLTVPRMGLLVAADDTEYLPYTGWDYGFPRWGDILAVRYSGGVAVEAQICGTNYVGRHDAPIRVAWSPECLQPIRWYRCDGDATDSVSTNDAVWVGNPGYTTGVNGGAWHFDGTNYLAANRCDATVTNMTIAFWVRRQNANAVSYVPFGGVIEVEGGVALQNNGARVVAKNTIASSIRYDIYPVEVQGTNWAHYAVTFTNGIVDAIFIKGVKYTDLNVSSGYTADGKYSMMMGARWLASGTEPTLMAPIELDDMLIFDRVLSDAEIQQIYEWRDTP